MHQLNAAVGFDLVVLLSCSGLILKKGVGHSHPAVLYLLFHALVVTTRAYALARDAPTLFSGLVGYEAVRPDEIARAVLYADIALIAGTVGWLSISRTRPFRQPDGIVTDGSWRPLRRRPIYMVSLVAMPVGFLVFIFYGFVPGVSGTRSADSSSYLTLALTWPGLVLIAFIYYNGFKARYLVPLAGFLGLIALQGYGRFRLILPVVLLVQVYLDRHRRRWPTPALTLVLLASVALFFPLKEIGRSVQAGEGVGLIGTSAKTRIEEAASGRSGDQTILDQFAVTIALADDSNQTLLGRPYLNLLVLPVPRPWWQAKPGLADYLKSLSTPSRPLDRIGGVTTLAGDLYLNFRLPGLALVMFLLARLSGRLYAAAYHRPYLSVGRFGFLLLSCNLIQIYRDGLISVPIFLLVEMLPLMVILLLHARRPLRGRSEGADAAYNGHWSHARTGLDTVATRRTA